MNMSPLDGVWNKTYVQKRKNSINVTVSSSSTNNSSTDSTGYQTIWNDSITMNPMGVATDSTTSDFFDTFKQTEEMVLSPTEEGEIDADRYMSFINFLNNCGLSVQSFSRILREYKKTFGLGVKSIIISSKKGDKGGG